MRFFLSVALTWLLAACSLLRPLPKPSSIDDRLAVFPTTALPLEGKVTIYWDDHQIPFIDAEHDGDLAFALGLVHAHLRLGQMAIYRRIAQGRVAEMGGPLAANVDHGLRILDFGRAAAETEAAMPAATHRWVERFVEGVNLYQDRLAQLPFEYAALGLEREPWTVRDVLTFGRLAGTDVTWLVLFNLLKLRERPDWPKIWARLVENGTDSVPSFDAEGRVALLDEVLGGLSRSGSNSLVIAPRHTATGGAIIASDPHLGINLPNTWLLAGVRSPSYHAVGLMVPGLPLFAIGRNPWIAWGGTNMRAAASDLVDVSAVPSEQIRERQETIAVRWWPDRKITVRETAWGPIISDAPQLKDLALPPLALRWTGHRASDEVTAMLAASRARTFEEFRGAFAEFAVPGQSMLYADAEGNIGQIMAVCLPARDRERPADMIVDSRTSDRNWASMRASADLPYSFNPEAGFLASANNRPTDAANVSIGYFFSPNDRVLRMAEIVGQTGRMGIDQVRDLQQDVFMVSSVELRDALLRKLDETGLRPASDARQGEVLDLIAAWDGRYEENSRGAVAFEIFRSVFTKPFYQSEFGQSDWAAFANVGRIKSLLIEDINRARAAELKPLLASSLAETARKIGKFSRWGDMHRLELRHPLAFLPIVGGRFRFVDAPAGGSTDTLMKTAHAAAKERHSVRYGSNARHISDMTDPDKNDFVLLGGQDGWLNSSTFLDQVPLWRRGEYIPLPLRIETVRERFSRRTELSP